MSELYRFLKHVAIAVVAFSFIVFCALFGSLPRLRYGLLSNPKRNPDIPRKTPIGFVNRLIWIRIPGVLYFLDRLITGGRFASTLKRMAHYLVHDNHPLVLVRHMSRTSCHC